jgi:uncharacterized protein
MSSTVSTQPAPEQSTAGRKSDAASATERIGSLDVLRGIALLGMFLVHFYDFATDPGGARGVTAVYRRIVTLFFEERFWTMFGILFGVGFAVQLRRAEARGGPFVRNYVRRLLALAGFGFIAHAVLGFNVLLGYAAWAFPLLLVRKWPMKALVLALVISAASGSIFYFARAVYRVNAVGEAAYLAEIRDIGMRAKAFRQANDQAQDAPDYASVFTARLAHMKWFYAQPFSFLPVNTFTMFLLGVIGLRLGLFDRPEHHRRLIVALMIFGAASWAAENWLFSDGPPPPPGELLRSMLLEQIKYGYGQVRAMWLSFTYIGIVLLLVAHNRAWLRRLGAFGWTGRMALTLYMLQIAVLDLTFSPYALHVQLTTLQGLAAGILLFLVNAALARWWLWRFRFGPLEWLWRSITYGHLQPWRLESVGADGSSTESRSRT